jgi:hypothetical protein
MYVAQDVMSREIVMVSPQATVVDAIRTLLEHGVSGVPVVDNGRLVGVLSEYQLLEVIYSPQVQHARVADYMTRDVLTVSENTSLAWPTWPACSSSTAFAACRCCGTACSWASSAAGTSCAMPWSRAPT